METRGQSGGGCEGERLVFWRYTSQAITDFKNYARFGTEQIRFNAL